MSEHLIDRALLEPVGASGRFHRPASTFRDWVSDDGLTPYSAVAGRYHLYVSLGLPVGAPHDHRAELKGLEDVIGMTVVDPIRDERGWAFTGGEYTDPVNGFRFLGQAYAATDPAYKGRLSVPVLWDRETKRIVNNESADVMRMYTTAFDGARRRARSTCTRPALGEEIDELNTLLYDDVNNGVYAAGFARDQDDYEPTVRTHVRDARRDRRAARRPPVPVRRRPGRDRLAPVHDAAALRRRLQQPLQVQPAPGRRLPAPVAVRARPLPAARASPTRWTSTTSAATTTYAPGDQPERDRGRGAGRGLGRAARPRVVVPWAVTRRDATSGRRSRSPTPARRAGLRRKCEPTSTHRERPADGEPAGLLVLHHGRGTDEHDLLGLADVLDPGGGCTSSRRARRCSCRAGPATTGTSCRASAIPTPTRSTPPTGARRASTTSCGSAPASRPSGPCSAASRWAR